MEKTLQEISEIIGGELIGDGSIKISGLGSIDTAEEGILTFADELHAETAKNSKASAVIMPANFFGELPKNTIKTADSKAAFAKLLEIFTPKIKIPVGISDKAYIGENVFIGENVSIMPFAVIDDFAEIKSGAII